MSDATGRIGLGLDPDDLAQCVGCGLCLPACPTYRVTGEESMSPRGRIAAMREVQDRGAPLDEAFGHVVETCVQCRGCEPVCPSSVPFGRLMERTRAAVADQHRPVPRAQRLGLWLLGHHRALVAMSRAGAVAQRFGLVPRRLGLPRLALREPALIATGSDAWLFIGCVMDAWMRPVHRATLAVGRAARIGFGMAGGGGCCGALALHAGAHDRAVAQAEATVALFSGDEPVVVDAAGCGAAMKEYGELLDTDEARRFATRVVDVHEFFAAHDLPDGARLSVPVAIQDPCHLRHVQGAHDAVRTVLAPYADLVELDDDGLCCGAGGAYALAQPDLAAAVRERKVEALRRAGAPVVASANPGCAMHLAAAGFDVRHPIELVAEAVRSEPRGR